MVVFIVIMILGYAMFYSGLSKWLTGGHGVTFFESLGVNPAILTVSTTFPSAEQVFPTSPSTVAFQASASPLFPTTSNTAGNVSLA